MEPKGLCVHSDALHGEKVGVGTLLVMAEYQRILEDKNINFKDYKEYDRDFLSKIFDYEMLNEILKENENDVASGITVENLRENFEKIAYELNKLPKVQDLKMLYDKLSVKYTLADIGVCDELAEKLLDFSPTVRN